MFKLSRQESVPAGLVGSLDLHQTGHQHTRSHSSSGRVVKEMFDDSYEDIVTFHRREIHRAIDDGKNQRGYDADGDRGDNFGRKQIIRRFFRELSRYLDTEIHSRTEDRAHHQTEKQVVARYQSDYNTNYYAD